MSNPNLRIVRADEPQAIEASQPGTYANLKDVLQKLANSETLRQHPISKQAERVYLLCKTLTVEQLQIWIEAEENGLENQLPLFLEELSKEIAKLIEECHRFLGQVQSVPGYNAIVSEETQKLVRGVIVSLKQLQDMADSIHRHQIPRYLGPILSQLTMAYRFLREMFVGAEAKESQEDNVIDMRRAFGDAATWTADTQRFAA